MLSLMLPLVSSSRGEGVGIDVRRLELGQHETQAAVVLDLGVELVRREAAGAGYDHVRALIVQRRVPLEAHR